MSRIYKITPTANREIEEILQQLALSGNFDTSDQFLRQITDKLTRIAAFPNLGKGRPAWGETYRSLPLNDYLIVYRVTDEMVEILRVVSGYRDLDSWFGS